MGKSSPPVKPILPMYYLQTAYNLILHEDIYRTNFYSRNNLVKKQNCKNENPSWKFFSTQWKRRSWSIVLKFAKIFMNLFLKGMQKLKDLLGGSKEDMRARSGSNTSAESFANNVCTGGGVKVVTDPKGFLAVPGILRVSLTLFVSGFDLKAFLLHW